MFAFQWQYFYVLRLSSAPKVQSATWTERNNAAARTGPRFRAGVDILSGRDYTASAARCRSCDTRPIPQEVFRP